MNRLIRSSTIPALGVLALALAGGRHLLVAGQDPVQFNRDIRPVLADNCLACHGPDPAARKAGLRLDQRNDLFESKPKRGPVITPGDPAKSSLWTRISTSDPDDLMPPPASKKALTEDQKSLLKRWIEAGAVWQDHWSFTPPQRPELPHVNNGAWGRNPVDSFILGALEQRGLTPAPEADRRTLARRAYLDLTGLPPQPEEVERFVNDASADAYEQLVRRLMASLHYGEHRARYWLDAARYADTHGLHFDNYREMWLYRDWVIRAFNRNMPFDQFVVEQLAGDLLPDPTDDQLVATGFQRCNMTTNEGGTIEEENLANYANDRVTTTGWVFLGLTANCAACHDHKFDPLTTKEFYSLAAFYRNTQQTGYDRNHREGEQFLVLPQAESDRQRFKTLGRELEMVHRLRATNAARADLTFTNWLMSLNPNRLRRDVVVGDEALHLPLTEGRGNHAAGRANGQRTRFSGPTALAWRRGPLGLAPVITTNQNFLLGDHGDFSENEPFSMAAWVVVPEDFKTGGAVLGRMDGEVAHHRGWDFFVREDYFGIHLIHRWPSIALRVRAKEKAVARGKWHHLAATYDGSLRASGVKLYLDGTEIEVNKDNDRLEGSIRTKVPLRLGQRETSDKLDGVGVQDARIFRRKLDAAEVALLAAAPRLPEVVAGVEWSATNNLSREVMRLYYRATQHRAWQDSTRTLLALEREHQLIRGRSPVTHIQREKTNAEPVAHILFRGQYDQPREKVGPATPAALHAFPTHAPRNRLGLARWLVAPDNPLTARVTVNRFWQELFGTGLVKTSEDFGVMGDPPVNPELLDWLATEFMASGWDVKHLLTLMVTSSAYRQSAMVTEEKRQKDPDNRLLSRGPRFRMDAEMLRDYALSASGLLAPRVGGPSVKPYQPGGVWEAVAMPESNTRFYARDTGEALYRRSLYTFWKRAAPPPSMEIFNAPSREVCTVRRERTNTPLQALATLNDPQYLEAARSLAERAWLHGRGRREQILDDIARRLLARPLSDAERTILQHTMDAAESYYQQQPSEALQLITTGESQPSPQVPPSDLAALTVVANQLMNLDEVLNK